jgi:hypothetical protein
MTAKPAQLVLAALAVVCWAGLSSAGGYDQGSRADFDAYLRATLREVDTPVEADAGMRHTREEVVEPKSIVRAMLLSALVPGLGEIYVGGRRGYVSGGVLVGVDLVSIYKYNDLNSRGDDLRDEYRDFADRYYSRQDFDYYVHEVVAAENPDLAFCRGGGVGDPVKCDSVLAYYFPLAHGDDFYEQIDVMPRFVFGWSDWEHQAEYVDYWATWTPDSEIDETVETETPLKFEYRSMRGAANEAYSSADKYAWLMVVGRVVSVVDALILARAHNSQLASLGSHMNLSFEVKSITDPAFKVGVKMRF